MNKIQTKLKILASSLMVMTFLALGAAPMVSAQVGAESNVTALSPTALRNAYLLSRLQQYLLSSQENYTSLQSKLEETRSEIEENRDRLATLQGQVQHLEKLAKESESKVRNVQEQIAEKERDITDTLKNLAFQEVVRNDQTQTLSSYLRLLYFEKNLYFGAGTQANVLKVLLQEGSVSSVLQTGFYLDLLKTQSESVMQNLQDLSVSIQAQTTSLTRKRHELASLREQLDGEHRNLAAELAGKRNFLAQTQGRDDLYRELFASYRLAQEAILSDINLFETNIEVLDDRIALLAPQLSEEDRGKISQIRQDAGFNFAIRAAAAFLNLNWPVSPKLGLTAFFEDPGYASTFGVSHQALDIRVAHGSVITAPADGVVYRVNDAAAKDELKERLGYGYLIIAHRKGAMTLYGHISAAMVKEGDFVQRGQIIGLTGGTPGTPGAGGRTTGAHLHFEVFQDGVRVDPFEYLPLEVIPEEVWGDVPEKYLAMIQKRLEQVLEEAGVDAGTLAEMDEDFDLENLQLETEETVKLTVPGIDEDSEGKVDGEAGEEFDEEAFWERGVD